MPVDSHGNTEKTHTQRTNKKYADPAIHFERRGGGDPRPLAERQAWPTAVSRHALGICSSDRADSLEVEFWSFGGDAQQDVDVGVCHDDHSLLCRFSRDGS